MTKRPSDIDSRQSLKDIFRTNRYDLDLRFLIKDGKKHPLAVIVPGGGYGMVCSFIEGVPIARKLNLKGISCAIVYYSIKKKALCPAPVDDLAKAVSELLAKADEYCLEMDNYSIWGSSAGGHLSGEFGSDNLGYRKYGLPKPGCLVLSYPVITMDKRYTHAGTRDNFLGKDPPAVLEEMASIDKHVDKDFPRTFVWCGDEDKVVSNENTRFLVQALQKNNIEHKYHIYKGVGHGVGPGTGTAAENWIDEAVEFWLDNKR